MTHTELGELYELYALGVLSQEERMEIEEHLARHCPECQTGVKKAFEMSAFFATLPEAIEPPRRLRQRVLASVGAKQPESRAWIWRLAFACAAILAVVVFIGNRRTADELRASAEELSAARTQIQRSAADLAKMHAAMAFLNEPETEQVVFGKGKPQPPRGRVFVNGQRGVLLLASNLPPAPAGKMYEMWLIPKTGAPKPAGMFQSESQGTAMYVMNGPIDRAQTKAVAVTMEPEAGSQAPTSTPMIVAGLTD